MRNLSEIEFEKTSSSATIKRNGIGGNGVTIIKQGKNTMNNVNELRQLIRMAILQEMNTTGGSGAIGTGGNIIQTPNAFTGNTKAGEARRKKNAAVVGYKLAPLRKGAISEHKRKLFEDIINKADGGIKLSDQATELSDFIHGTEKYSNQLEDIKNLFAQMQSDGTFTKEEAFKVYGELIERASRDFTKATGQNMDASEYFLRKDILDLIYQQLSRIETPTSGLPSDNIDVGPNGEVPPPAAGGAPAPDTGGGGGGGGVQMPGEEVPPEGEAPPEGGVPPEGEGVPPEGEGVPPEGEEAPPEGEEELPKPEDITELKRMIKEIYQEASTAPSGISSDSNTYDNEKLETLAEIQQLIAVYIKDYSKKGEREFALNLVKIKRYIDSLSDKIALSRPSIVQVSKKRMSR